MTNYTRQSNRFGEAPSGQAVDTLMDRLLSDPGFVIEVMVGNNYPAVSNRYTLATGKVASSAQALITDLKAMRQRGGLDRAKARYAISVPYEAGRNPAIDIAVSSLRSEWLALQTDPQFSGTAKNAPLFDPLGGAGNDQFFAPGGDPGASDTGAANDFWNSLPGILTGLGGVVGAFTGNVPPAQGGAGNAAPAAQRQPTNWTTVVLIGLAIAAAITGVALIIRAARKK